MSRRDYFKEENRLKKIAIIFTIALILSVISFILIFNFYNKKLMEEAKQNLLELGSINAVVPNTTEVETNPASTSLDSGINEVKKENVVEKETIKTHKVEETEVVEEKVENTVEEVIIEETVISTEELEFIAPISGEIIKDFAIDNLVYSKTLEEWTTHNGIDIRAEKTEVVSASEKGVVESIKSDPRYGLTVTVSHTQDFKTVYSNLLVADFVSVGEEIEKGQAIGTVGESSSFEIADEAHLHFEMIKAGEYVNPTLYFK